MIEIGRERQLLVDDRLVAVRSGLTRRLHPARKRPAPVLEAQEPWEGRRVYCFGSVFRDEAGRYRMWYIARLGGGNEERAQGLERHGDLVLQATSSDGVNWERPHLELVAFDGTRRNNILFVNGHCPSVLVDPAAPVAERHRMAVNLWRGADTGYALLHSADGLTWREYPQSPMFSGAGALEVMSLARDPRTGRFFAYHRRWADNYRPRRRVIAASWSDDFRFWSPAKLILTPDQRDERGRVEDGLGTEFYDMSGFWYENGFLGILPVFRVQSYRPEITRDGAVQSPWDGPIDAQLAHSRDGENWVRFEDRAPVLPRGNEGSFDAGCILGCADRPVVEEDRVLLYYTGVNTTHGGSMPPKTISIGLATWRRDGFVSMDAGDVPGVLETPAILATGDRLCVNADAGGGSLEVEVVSPDGDPRRGYARGECVELRTDALRHTVRWRDRDGIDTAGPLILRFHMRRASLYSFWFEEGGPRS